MKGKYLACLLLCLAALTSCHQKQESESAFEKEGLSDTLVTKLYRLGVDGHYDECVSAMASCENTTADYKKQVVLALKHHNAEVEKHKKGVAKVEFLRATLHDNNQMANTYLNVTFKDGSVQEILFPLVKVNGVWKIQ